MRYLKASALSQPSGSRRGRRCSGGVDHLTKPVESHRGSLERSGWLSGLFGCDPPLRAGSSWRRRPAPSGRNARWLRPAACAMTNSAGSVCSAGPGPRGRLARFGRDIAADEHGLTAARARIAQLEAEPALAAQPADRLAAERDAWRRQSPRRRRPPARTASSAADRPHLGRPPPAAEAPRAVRRPLWYRPRPQAMTGVSVTGGPPAGTASGNVRLTRRTMGHRCGGPETGA
jgi:hypothetical protein